MTPKEKKRIEANLKARGFAPPKPKPKRKKKADEDAVQEQ